MDDLTSIFLAVFIILFTLGKRIFFKPEIYLKILLKHFSFIAYLSKEKVSAQRYTFDWIVRFRKNIAIYKTGIQKLH